MKSDGSFVLETPSGERITGSYDVDGTTITLKVGSVEGKGTIEGDKLTDPDGNVFVKET